MEIATVFLLTLFPYSQELLEKEGVNLVFTPTATEIYPTGYTTVVNPGPSFGEGGRGEGGARPHFFAGVATVCTKLLHIVQPQRAYFGQKDAMQCAVLRTIVRDLCIPTEVVVLPTERAADGLALSSRNAHLGPEERSAAPTVFAALSSGAQVYREAVITQARLLRSRGEIEGRFRGRVIQKADVEAKVHAVLALEPLIEKVEYVSLAFADNMQELGPEVRPSSEDLVLSCAILMRSGVRLIDNVVLPGALPVGTSAVPRATSAVPRVASDSAVPDSAVVPPLTPFDPPTCPSARGPASAKAVSVVSISRKVKRGKKLSMVTAYSAPQGELVDASGADLVLVGDSVGMTELGFTTTQPVTLEHMLHHVCFIIITWFVKFFF